MAARRPVHLEAKPGDVAEIAVVSGDPGRVGRLSKLLDRPRLVSSSRGLPVYTGLRRGVRVTVAAHGIGGPSALIVAEELFMLGARIVVRLGTAGSLDPGHIGLGDVVVASASGLVCMASGVALYAGLKPICPPSSPDPALAVHIYRRLSNTLKGSRRVVMAPVFTSDSFYAETPWLAEELRSLGFKAIEMEVAPLAALAWSRGFRFAAALIVSDVLERGFPRIGRRELEEAEAEVGEALLDALVELEEVGGV